MERRKACGQRVLAAGEGCRVHQCGHGTVHVTIGRMTFRVAPDELAAVAETLGAATANLRAPDAPAPARLLC